MDNVQKMMRLYNNFMELYKDGGVLTGIAPYEGLQIRQEKMEEVAPLSEWNLNLGRHYPEEYPYQHEVVIYGHKFFCISTDPISLDLGVKQE